LLSQSTDFPVSAIRWLAIDSNSGSSVLKYWKRSRPTTESSSGWRLRESKPGPYAVVILRSRSMIQNAIGILGRIGRPVSSRAGSSNGVVRPDVALRIYSPFPRVMLLVIQACGVKRMPIVNRYG